MEGPEHLQQQQQGASAGEEGEGAAAMHDPCPLSDLSELEGAAWGAPVLLLAAAARMRGALYTSTCPPTLPRARHCHRPIAASLIIKQLDPKAR